MLFLLACLDYKLNNGETTVGTFDGDTAVPCPPNFPECRDSDSSTIPESDPPDPQDCEVQNVLGTTVPIVEECEGSGTITVTDPWNIVVDWQWQGLSTDSSVQDVITVPIIGNLTDDNGDGRIDESDSPDIMTVASRDSDFTNGTLVILDGTTGAEIWTKSGYNAAAGGVIADVDGDGVSDVVVQNSAMKWVALAADGTVLWTTSSPGSNGYPQATVADLDEDGDVEVLADNQIIDGQTGSIQATLTGASCPYRIPAVGDLDQDGKQEISLCNNVYDYRGNLLWSAPFTGTYGHWAAIFDFDGDSDGEIGMMGSGRYAVFDPDGTTLASANVNSAQPGPPCVADFDGDGESEIAWASSGTFSMYELDGTVIWTEAVDDSSGLAACSGYDINGDGAYEVLFADQDKMFVFDGPTGAVQYENNGHASGTLWEYPAVADIDHDGSAEIVIGSNNYGFPGWGGITVFGHVSNGWPRSGSTWAVHDFAVTNVNPDGTVPTVPVPSWQAYNVYRARPAVDNPAGLDLNVSLADLCVASCTDGPIKIAVQVSNQGAVDVDAGIAWAFYKNDGGTLTVVTTGTLPAILAGHSIDSFEISVLPTDIGDQGFIVAVDDDGTGQDVALECDESNNQIVYGDPLCR